jgi:murein DD-endopeptidase MepM/ murein hydrolase activator NlpD
VEREDGLANCGWTRLAYLLFGLTILIALAQLGSPRADPRPLTSKPADRATAKGEMRELAQTTQHEETVPIAFADRDSGSDENGASAAARPGPPVFYRPAPVSPTPERGGGPVCADLGTFPGNRTLAFPLPREYLNSYEDTWGAPRPQGGHEGTDLMAPTGTPEYAVTDGTIVPVAGANTNGWNTLGGYAVMLKAAYSIGPVKKGDLFYYAHLERESALEIGTRVRVGQTVGYAGDTGQGPEVTRGLFPPHLHVGWYDATGARSTATSGAMNPYPLLEWMEANGGAITGGSDARYCEAPRIGGPTPSTGESRWPATDSPGVSPDLDTSSPRGAAPKPAPRTTGPSSSEPPNPPAPRAKPSPAAPGDEPPKAASDRGSAENHPDAPIPEAEPEGDKANDPPGEVGKGRKGDPGAEREKDEQGEDITGERPSPDEDQYAPETGGESRPATTAG